MTTLFLILALQLFGIANDFHALMRLEGTGIRCESRPRCAFAGHEGRRNKRMLEVPRIVNALIGIDYLVYSPVAVKADKDLQPARFWLYHTYIHKRVYVYGRSDLAHFVELSAVRDAISILDYSKDRRKNDRSLAEDIALLRKLPSLSHVTIRNTGHLMTDKDGKALLQLKSVECLHIGAGGMIDSSFCKAIKDSPAQTLILETCAIFERDASLLARPGRTVWLDNCSTDVRAPPIGSAHVISCDENGTAVWANGKVPIAGGSAPNLLSQLTRKLYCIAEWFLPAEDFEVTIHGI